MTGLEAVLLVAWIAAVLGPVLAVVVWRRVPPPRRIGWGFRTAAALYVLAYGFGVWAFLVEPSLLTVRRVAVASPSWSGPPLRIGVVSDTHVGASHVDPVRVLMTVRRLNREKPDLIVFLGDYAGGHEPSAVRAAPDRSAIMRGVTAMGMRSAAPLGKAAVLGEHDWWFDGSAIEAQLTRSGVTVLENGAVRIARAGGAFWVAGVADADSRRARPSPELALGGVPQGEPVILLSHRPDIYPQVPAQVALTLAGHSHCGQIVLPVLGRPVQASPGSARWPCGLYGEGERAMFVTSGLGVSILPARLGAPPEVALVTLSAAP